MILDGFGCLLLDGKLIAGSKAHSTEHRLTVDGEGQIRINRCADDFFSQVV